MVIDWHQDGNPVTEGNPNLAGAAQGGGWGLTIDPRLTVWTALDKTTIENGALQIIRAIGHRTCLSACLHTLANTTIQAQCLTYTQSQSFASQRSM